MKGKDEANEVADWVAGNANSRILFLNTQRQSVYRRVSIFRLVPTYVSLNPNVPLIWLLVVFLPISKML